LDPTDVTELQRRYAAHEDGQLVRLALTGAADLTPVACDVLKAELAARNLVPELRPTLDIRVERFTASELDSIALRLQFLPCPKCGRSTTSLNGFTCEKPTPLMAVGLHRVPEFHIGCQPCLAKEGAWRLFKLKPGQRWKPSEAFRNWVFSHAALFTCFQANEVAIAALLRLDYRAFLQAIASAAPTTAETEPAGARQPARRPD
jgi:hypothetical protein